MKMMMMISEIHHLGFCFLYKETVKEMHLDGLTVGILDTSAVRFQLLCYTCKTVSLNY